MIFQDSNKWFQIDIGCIDWSAGGNLGFWYSNLRNVQLKIVELLKCCAWLKADDGERYVHRTEKKNGFTKIACVFPVDRRALWSISNEIGHDQVCGTYPNGP